MKSHPSGPGRTAALLAVLAVWTTPAPARLPPPEIEFRPGRSGEPIQALRRVRNGLWQLDLALRPARPYSIEVSTNGLLWREVTNLTSATGRLLWTDPELPRQGLRLYRVSPRGFHAVRRLNDGALEFLLGLPPGREYLIETSTNLLDWTPWTSLLSHGPVQRFVQQPAPEADRLFFRVRPTGGYRLETDPSGGLTLYPTQQWGVAYRVEVSTNLQHWQTTDLFIGTNSLRHIQPPPAARQLAWRVNAVPMGRAFDAFIILGQSNAVGCGELADAEPPDPAVWMLGNDYQLKLACEPLDDSVGQVDLVSADWPIYRGGPYGHSWGLRAAKGVTAARGNQLLLIPCAKGGTRMAQWMPGTNRYDRTTLFGSANYRRSLAAPEGLKAIWYYGHESNTEQPFIGTYLADWTRLIAELRADYGPVPVIYAQLALSTEAWTADILHAGAELQRRMETGSGDSNALAAHFMVVTFDLPLVDYVHLSREGVKTLGDRFALATRQHIYGEPINGTGPRLVSLTHPGGDQSRVKIRFTRPINQAFNNYDHQFRVFDAGREVRLRRAERDADPTAVLLTLEAPASGPVEVSYGHTVRRAYHVALPNVVKDSDGLPAPAFGRQPVQ